MDKGDSGETRLTPEDLEFAPDYIWYDDGHKLVPRLPYLEWWQQVAEERYGDEARWLDAALEMGYVVTLRDPSTGQTWMEPALSDYDAGLALKSLGTSKEARSCVRILASMARCIIKKNEGPNED